MSRNDTYPPPADEIHPIWQILIGSHVVYPFVLPSALTDSSFTGVGIIFGLGVVDIGARRLA